MTQPGEITDEIRRAVHAEDCDRLGHQFELRNMLVMAQVKSELAGPDGQLPHVFCTRCDRVWLVVGDEPGSDYADALAKLTARVRVGREPRPKPELPPRPGRLS